MARRRCWKAMLAVVVLPAFSTLASAQVTNQQAERIREAVPEKARVTPKKHRRVMIWNTPFMDKSPHKGYSIPQAEYAMKLVGEKTGAFESVVSDDVAMYLPENLKKFDAIIMNNSCGRWIRPTEKDMEKFKAHGSDIDALERLLRKSLFEWVSNGGGIVAYHFAIGANNHWPEFHEMLGAGYWGHPWNEEIGVKVEEPEHPLLAVFEGKNFRLTEEIFQFREPYSREKVRVLLSLDIKTTNMNVPWIHRKDGDFALAWVRQYGKGRVFYCAFGHRTEIWWNPTILRFYLDGIQFVLGDLEAKTAPLAPVAAMGQLDDPLKAVVTFEHGKDASPLVLIEQLVVQAAKDGKQRHAAEQRILRALHSASTRDAKSFLCRQLRTIGTARSVPQLEKLLSDPELSHMARYALGRIEDPSAAAALHRALGKTSGKLQVGIVNTLADRRYREALPDFTKLLHSSDSGVAEAAARALGRIGGIEAVKALESARLGASKVLRERIDNAVLICAEEFLAGGQTAEAAGIYEKLYRLSQKKHFRLAGLRGLAAARGEQAAPLLIEFIKGSDPDLRRTAIGLTATVKGQDATKAFVALLPSLPPEAQELMLHALGARGDAAAVQAVSAATKSQHEAVRLAALEALGSLGDSSAVSLLSQAAAGADGAEKQMARASLV